MAFVPNGTAVRVVKGTACGCYGTVRTSVWMPSGVHMFGIELSEPMGLNDGRFKDGTPYFHCKPYHGVYLMLDAFVPEDASAFLEDALERDGARHHHSVYGPDRLGLQRHNRGVKDPAVVGDPAAEAWAPVVGTMGSSYVASFQAGDWHGMHAEAKSESQEWARATQQVANELHAKETECEELIAQLELYRIKHHWKNAEKVDHKLTTAKVTVLKRELDELSEHKTSLADLRAAEDHRKPRSSPSSPALSGVGANSALLQALEGSFEGAKTLLPEQDHRKPKWEHIKGSSKWDCEEPYRKVRGF